jgi:hypothetical protein
VCLARESALITLRPCARISSDPAFRRQLLTARVFFLQVPLKSVPKWGRIHPDSSCTGLQPGFRGGCTMGARCARYSGCCFWRL